MTIDEANYVLAKFDALASAFVIKLSPPTNSLRVVRKLRSCIANAFMVKVVDGNVTD